ncbi:unnamed protein product [Amoebophrya sp. A120]|nr:unnamed protein product [Amoebophrya sp. A120]|eukprot:GSA120T00024089001.1
MMLFVGVCFAGPNESFSKQLPTERDRKTTEAVVAFEEHDTVAAIKQKLFVQGSSIPPATQLLLNHTTTDELCDLCTISDYPALLAAIKKQNGAHKGYLDYPLLQQHCALEYGRLRSSGRVECSAIKKQQQHFAVLAHSTRTSTPAVPVNQLGRRAFADGVSQNGRENKNSWRSLNSDLRGRSHNYANVRRSLQTGVAAPGERNTNRSPQLENPFYNFKSGDFPKGSIQQTESWDKDDSRSCVWQEFVEQHKGVRGPVYVELDSNQLGAKATDFYF